MPLRSLYSRRIANLFFAGRNISATHYALSSTRVMLTCAQLGEAVGMAPSHAVRSHLDPRSLTTGGTIPAIQTDLLMADRTAPEQSVYDPKMVVIGASRPTRVPNLWASSPSSFTEPEWIELEWDSPRDIGEIQILFDSSLHFHFGQRWQGYAVNSIPSLVKDYRLVAEHVDGTQTVGVEVAGNFHDGLNAVYSSPRSATSSSSQPRNWPSSWR